MFLVGKHLDDAVDGLGGIRRMQGSEHQVAGCGGFHRQTNRLEVPHFADEDDVRVLAQRAAQGGGERPRMRATSR